MAEAHALWKGLVQMKSQGITKAMVFGDSRLLIQAMITTPKSSNLKLTNLVKRIHLLSHSFQKIEFFHILRSLNSEADREANKETLLNKGDLLVNNEVQNVLLP
jgi:ribonuclease HI